MLGLEAERSGETVVITANVHGDEVGGVAAVHELWSRLGSALRRGTVWLYPSLNPDGLASASRSLPADGADLNRCFPGHTRGRASERHAHALWADLVARKPDVLIDLHSDSARAVPYAIVDRPTALAGRRRRALGRRLEELAHATGLTVLREYLDEDYQRFSLENSLTGALVNLHGVAAVTLECGPRRVVADDATRVLVDAVMGVLGAVGCVDHQAVSHPTRIGGGPWRRRSGPRAGVEGLLRPVLAPGVPFAEGDVLARIVALDGTTCATLRADEGGVVVAWSELPWLRPSDVTGTLGVLDDGSL